MEGALAENGIQKVVKEGFKMTSLDRCQMCNAVRQCIAESGLEWTARPLSIIQVTRHDGQNVSKVEAIRLYQLTNRPTTIGCMVRSSLSVMEVFLNYVGTFELLYVSFLEDCIKYLVDRIMPLRYLPTPSHSSYTLYVRVGFLMTTRGEVLPIVEAQNER